MSIETVPDNQAENQSPSESPSTLHVEPEVVSTPVTDNETENPDDLIRVLKCGSCPSLTGRSTLGYQLGCKGESELYLSLTSNTGSGFFSKEWVACQEIEQLITGAAELTSTSFKRLFPNKSVNTGGFVMAVVKALGLIQTNEENSRWHEHIKGMTFEKVAIESMEQEGEVEKLALTKAGKRKSKEV